MSKFLDAISIRPMTAADIGSIPIRCQGTPAEVIARIAELGSSAMLAFDGVQHVGQLQFRRWEPGIRSPNGVWDPLYWADFADLTPELPAGTLAIFCYHVGQRDDTDARDPDYQGRGLGVRLLNRFLAWATQSGFAAVIAKATPPYPRIMNFMGGQRASVYRARGFEIVSSWVDPDLRVVVEDRGLIPDGVDSDDAALVSCCVRWLRAADRIDRGHP